MRALARRVARLESSADRERPATYAVRVPADAIGNDEAIEAVIAEHRRQTGYMGAVLIVPPEMTVTDWVARYGRGD